MNARTRNARTQKTTPNDEFQIREKARVGRSVLPFGAEGGLRQRDVRAERVERVGVQARSLGAARREGPAGGRGEGGFGRGRRPLNGHGGSTRPPWQRGGRADMSSFVSIVRDNVHQTFSNFYHSIHIRYHDISISFMIFGLRFLFYRI